jgi:Flp pilus assembly protein TadD
MNASATAQTPAVEEYLRRTTMQSILEIDQASLDHVMATAYVLYQAGRYREVDVLCRGLVAADHTYWWSYSLHAAALRRLGRFEEALSQLERGLAYEPDEAKLLMMRGEILASLGEWRERPTASAASAQVGG